MIVHISDKSKYKRSDSYARKMLYTNSIFGATYEDYKRISADPRIKSKCVVWYVKTTTRNGFAKQKAKYTKKGR